MLEAKVSDTLPTLMARLKPVTLKRAGAALGLWGEAGIGKTHAVQHLLRELPCKSFSFHATTPLTEILRTLPLNRLPVWAQALGERARKGESLEGQQAADALGAALAALAPVVLHLEDIHEASPQQLEAIERLGQPLSHSKGVALLVTSRTLPPEPFQAVRLEPLAEADAAQLLQTQLGAGLPQEAQRWIYNHARGNPLFSLEYLRYLTRQGNLWNDGERWHWRKPELEHIPGSVEALIETVLAEASQDPLLEKVLSVRALLPGADKATWAKIAGTSYAELEAALLRLEAREIWHQGGFVHPLYPEVLVKNLHPLRRQALARQIIQALSEGDPQTAARFVRGAQLVAAEALALLKRAAEEAREAGSTVQAGRFLAQASDYSEGDEAGRLAFEAARLLQSADYPETIRLCELALGWLPSDIELIWYTADVYHELGQPELAQKTLLRLPPEHRSGPDWVLHMLQTTLGDVKSKVELWNAHPEVHSMADPLTVYRVAYALDAVGEHEQARKMALQVLARENLAPLRQAQMYSVVGSTYYKQEKAAESVEWNHKALQVLRSIGHQRGIAAVLGNQAHALENLDRYDQAMANYQEALQILSELGNPFDYAIPVRNLGVYHHWFGEYEQAEALMLEATAIFSKAGTTEYLVDCGRDLCLLYLDWNRPHGLFLAKKYAHMGLQTAQTLGAPRIRLKVLTPLVRAERMSGNLEQALELAEQACALAEQIEPRQSSPYVERALCFEALGHKEEALEQLRLAESIALAEGRTTSIDDIGLELDRLSGNVERALERLERFKQLRFMNRIQLALRDFPALAQRLQPTLSAAAPTQAQASSRLEVLGPMRLDGKNIQGSKRQELLAYLLQTRMAGRGEASKLELLDALYPNTPEEQAWAALKKSVSQIRSSLGQGLIQTTASGYALGAVSSDAEAFLQSGDTLLWRGEYLAGVLPVNETLGEVLYEALQAKAQALLQANPKEAVRVGRILLWANPYSTTALALTLGAMQKADNHKSLYRLYAQAKAQLAEVGETLPERWQDFLLMAASS